MKPKRTQEPKLPGFDTDYDLVPNVISGTDDVISQMTGYVSSISRAYKTSQGIKKPKVKKTVTY